MNHLQQSYAELIHLTKIFLHREFPLKSSPSKGAAPTPPPAQKNETPKLQAAPSSLITQSPAAIPPPLENEKPLNSPAEIESQVPSPLPIEKISPPSTPVASVSNHEKQSQKKHFAPEPLNQNGSVADFKSFWNLCETAFPQWKVSESIPSDAKGRKNKQAWKKHLIIPTVIILSFNTNSQQLSFLENLAQAITLRFAPAKVVSISQMEKEGRLESFSSSPKLRLVIACDHELYMHPKLMQSLHLQEKEGKYFLHEIPLILFSDFSLYLKESQLKAFVWRTICKEFTQA